MKTRVPLSIFLVMNFMPIFGLTQPSEAPVYHDAHWPGVHALKTDNFYGTDTENLPACGNYYYFTKHNVVQMTAYDHKDRSAVVITYTISEVKNTPTGMQSKVHSEAKDDKGNVLGGGDGIFKCENGELSADMHIASPISAGQFSGMEVKSTRAFLTYPSKMAVGQTLPGTSFHADVFQDGRLFTSVDYKVDHRKVEGAEKITTPAGSWQCFRITYNMIMKMNMGFPIPMRYQVTEWFAPGFGIVKTKNYKKGKVAGWAQLTKVNQ